MHRPNPVQAIGQQRQHFSVGGGQQPTLAHELEQDLALEIYARVVSGMIGMPNYSTRPSESELKAIAHASKSASRAFFEENNTNG